MNLTAERVSYAYVPGTTVLQDVSMSVDSGTALFVLGRILGPFGLFMQPRIFEHAGNLRCNGLGQGNIGRFVDAVFITGRQTNRSDDFGTCDQRHDHQTVGAAHGRNIMK